MPVPVEATAQPSHACLPRRIPLLALEAGKRPDAAQSPGWTEQPLGDGRVALLPEAGDDAEERWRVALAASALLRRERIVTPVPPTQDWDEGEGRVLLRPRLPTLRALWPSLTERGRRRVLRSAGALIRRMHQIRLAGFGPLDPRVPEGRPLQWLLADELGVRGFPAMAASCPEALGVVEGLLETIPEVAARSRTPPRLTHNGLSAGNLLCLPGAHTVVGVAGPGCPGGWPIESDLAHIQVADGILAGLGSTGVWFDELLEGYGEPLDEVLLAFFRALHLVRRLLTASRTATPIDARWVDAAMADMSDVHAAYEARVRAAAASAGLPPAETMPLLPQRPTQGGARPGRAARMRPVRRGSSGRA